MASPRLTCGGVTAFGLPSTSAKWRFMFGNFLTACTNAYPIRCVKEILPPRVRLRWLLMTIRLSIISFAGIARTLVAVGTSSDEDMFFTTAAAAPRSTCTSSPCAGAGPAGAFGLAAGFSGSGALAGAATTLAAAAFGAGAGAGSGGAVGAGACAGCPLPVVVVVVVCASVVGSGE